MNPQLVDAVKALHAAGVVAHPTETCYGLAADIFQKPALERLYALKKMSFEKPVSVLVRDLDEAQRYGEFSVTALQLALKYWPGALTIIVPRKSTVPEFLNYGHPTIGFRCSSNAKTKELVEAFGGPLTTTSANITTLPQAYSVQEMLDQNLVPDFVIDGGRIGQNPPSTIVEVIGDEMKVIRQGEIKL